jgi:hypothetical protein
MWATLAIATAVSLAPNQAGQLKLSNPRTTYGFLGSIRENNKFLPGDVIFLTFDIDGLTVDKSGTIKYSMGMQMKDSGGKQVFGQVPQPVQANNTLGGTSTRGMAYGDIGGDTSPGKYTLTVTVKDESSGKSDSISRDFEVLKKDFGIGRVGLFSNDQRTPTPPVFVVGQSAWVHFWTFGFERDKEKNPNLEVKMRVFDDAGKPTLGEPFTGESKSLPANVRSTPWWQKIELNRAGKFKVELEATDNVTKKTVKETLNISVLDGK